MLRSQWWLLWSQTLLEAVHFPGQPQRALGALQGSLSGSPESWAPFLLGLCRQRLPVFSDSGISAVVSGHCCEPALAASKINELFQRAKCIQRGNPEGQQDGQGLPGRKPAGSGSLKPHSLSGSPPMSGTDLTVCVCRTSTVA